MLDEPEDDKSGNRIIALPRERLVVAPLEEYSDLRQDLRKEKQVDIPSRRRYLWEEHLLALTSSIKAPIRLPCAAKRKNGWTSIFLPPP
ncbi:hypothetical protein AXF42_Ash018665 [Apostasia shenzhenica]|uniref:Uncharacterized protein n=1 Tax=Apostasia shenzhenica TaxID=1088818 RepID=A0A2I0B1N5_9ASPA|nr:hypothetical protein AXF42_Ash018665 [Apostasia shenzhenica]